MMSIIGWMALIYIFVGCMFTITYYAVLSYHDEFDVFLSDTYDATVPKYIERFVSERSFAGFMTIVFIFNWLIIALTIIYLIIMDGITKKDEA